MNHTVCVRYSISTGNARDGVRYLRQLEASIRSLRELDRTLPIVVFSYGTMPEEMEVQLRTLQVQRVRKETYETRLTRLVAPALARVLAVYPPLQKYLDLNHPSMRGYAHILQADCDTLFFDHPMRLVESYGGSDLAAREEVGTSAAGSPPARRFIDEHGLARLMRDQRCQPVQPFNSGLVLMSRLARRILGKREELFIDYAARFLAWMCANPIGHRSEFGESRVATLARASKAATKALARYDDRMLSYPSRNRWLLEEFALWMVCGSKPALEVSTFSPNDVGIGSEVFRSEPDEVQQVVHHYFSGNTQSVARWLHRSPGVSRKPVMATRRAPIVRDRSLPPAAIQNFRRRGYLVLRRKHVSVPFDDLLREAEEKRSLARPQRLDSSDSQEGRGGHPLRRFHHAGGGAALERFGKSESVLRLLARCCGRTVVPTGSNGSYSYYTKKDDFIGLHLDVVDCDVVLITCLRDDSSPRSANGALALYPTRRMESIASLNADPLRGVEAIKLAPGESLALIGGAIPHRILPVAARQNRIICVTCYKALGPPAASNGYRSPP